ncbi:MAG: hypothetical protein LBM98_10535 [Oscillospiraceae bacterium]|nr:hypothetical protein [Oscillospiraceae bacterium]
MIIFARGVRRAAHRHCEAPVSPRYVGRYRCEAIQCREDNIRLTYRRIVRQPWIASLRFIGAYRKCGGGFAKTGRALPCPAPCGAPRAGRGKPPRRLRAAPLPRGE